MFPKRISFSSMSNQTQIILQKYLFPPYMDPWQVLLLQVKMDLGVKAMKGYSTILRSPELEPHY